MTDINCTNLKSSSNIIKSIESENVLSTYNFDIPSVEYGMLTFDMINGISADVNIVIG